MCPSKSYVVLELLLWLSGRRPVLAARAVPRHPVSCFRLRLRSLPGSAIHSAPGIPPANPGFCARSMPGRHGVGGRDQLHPGQRFCGRSEGSPPPVQLLSMFAAGPCQPLDGSWVMWSNPGLETAPRVGGACVHAARSKLGGRPLVQPGAFLPEELAGWSWSSCWHAGRSPSLRPHLPTSELAPR